MGRARSISPVACIPEVASHGESLRPRFGRCADQLPNVVGLEDHDVHDEPPITSNLPIRMLLQQPQHMPLRVNNRVVSRQALDAPGEGNRRVPGPVEDVAQRLDPGRLVGRIQGTEIGVPGVAAHVHGARGHLHETVAVDDDVAAAALGLHGGERRLAERVPGDEAPVAAHHVDGLALVAVGELALQDLEIVHPAQLEAVVILAAADVAQGNAAQDHGPGGRRIVTTVIDADAVRIGVLDCQPLEHDIAGIRQVETSGDLVREPPVDDAALGAYDRDRGAGLAAQVADAADRRVAPGRQQDARTRGGRLHGPGDGPEGRLVRAGTAGVVALGMHVQGGVVRRMPIEGHGQPGGVGVAGRGLGFGVDRLSAFSDRAGSAIAGLQQAQREQADEHGRCGGCRAAHVEYFGWRFNLRILTNYAWGRDRRTPCCRDSARTCFATR